LLDAFRLMNLARGEAARKRRAAEGRGGDGTADHWKRECEGKLFHSDVVPVQQFVPAMQGLGGRRGKRG
jgi:hypothetical protein